jgi:type II secretory pathway predicted ATPase ExeA
MSLLYHATRTSSVIVTSEMEIAFQRVNLVHRGGSQMVAVVGPAGTGKTTSMRLLAQRIDEDAVANVANAWRTIYYASDDLRLTHKVTLERHVFAQLLTDGLVLSVDKDLRRNRPEDLRQKILIALRQRNIQMIFIDEAGQIPALGLNALANLVNAAELADWPLTIVLIGMDELPLEIAKFGQVERRVEDTILYQPYGPVEALEALAQVEPFFAALDLASEEGQTVMEFMTSPEVSCGGALGRMIKLVRRTAEQCRRDGTVFCFRELRMTHQLSARDQQRAVESARNGWRTGSPADTPASPKVAKPKRHAAGGTQ